MACEASIGDGVEVGWGCAAHFAEGHVCTSVSCVAKVTIRISHHAGGAEMVTEMDLFGIWKPKLRHSIKQEYRIKYNPNVAGI